MFAFTKTLRRTALIAALFGFAAPAGAGVGDLLVAPTRIVLDGRKGTEIILNNVGPAAFLQNWVRYKQDLQEVRDF